MSYRSVDRLGRVHWRDIQSGRFVKAPVPVFCWRFTFGVMFAERKVYHALIGQVWCEKKSKSMEKDVKDVILDRVALRSQAFWVEAEGWQEVPYEDGEAEGFGQIKVREEERSKRQWKRK